MTRYTNKRTQALLQELRKTAIHEAGHAVAEEIRRARVEYVSVESTSTQDDSRRVATVPQSEISPGYTEPARITTIDPSTTD